MTEIQTVLLLYLAAALLYGAARVKGRARLALLEKRPRARFAQLLAALLVVAALCLWRSVESGPAAALVALVGLMVMGTAVTLLGPIAPRLVWGAAALAATAIPVLALIRGLS